MSDLKYILKIKRKLKGEEAGRAILKDLAYGNRQVVNGTGTYKPLFSMSEKAYIQDNIINDPYEVNMYNRFVHLCNSIMDASKSMAIHNLSANYGITHLNLTTVQLLHNSIIRNDVPYIMTEKEYNETRERHLQESLKDENGEYYWYNFITIIGRAFNYYLYETGDKDPKYEHIYKVMRDYDEEACKDEYLISQYNRVRKIGYYTKPDGTKVQKGEMIKKLVEDAVKEKSKALGVESPTDIDTVDSGALTVSFIQKRAKLEEVYEAEERLKDTFTYSTETEPFTLWSILDDATEFYPDILEDTEAGKKQRKHFMDTFKDLIDEVVKQLDADYFDGELSKRLKAGEDLLEIVYRADDLQKRGFPHLLITTEAELMGWDEPYCDRVRNAGVAVLKCSGLTNSTKWDKVSKGNDPLNTLTRLYNGDLDSEKDGWIPSIEQSIYYIQGYNKGLELIAEYTGVKELTSLQKKINPENIEAFNTGYYLTLYELDEDGDKNGREKLKQIYRPIRTDYKIPEERINKARSLLVGLEGFKDKVGNYEFMDILTTFVPEEHQ